MLIEETGISVKMDKLHIYTLDTPPISVKLRLKPSKRGLFNAVMKTPKVKHLNSCYLFSNIFSKQPTTSLAFSLEKHNGGLDLSTLSKGPSVLIRILAFLNSFFIC